MLTSSAQNGARMNTSVVTGLTRSRVTGRLPNIAIAPANHKKLHVNVLSPLLS